MMAAKTAAPTPAPIPAFTAVESPVVSSVLLLDSLEVLEVAADSEELEIVDGEDSETADPVVDAELVGTTSFDTALLALVVVVSFSDADEVVLVSSGVAVVLCDADSTLDSEVVVDSTAADEVMAGAASVVVG